MASRRRQQLSLRQHSFSTRDRAFTGNARWLSLSREEELQKEKTLAESDEELTRAENDNDDNDDATIYNGVPIFTGSVITACTLFLTIYGIYAGLTGDDPLAGHPKP